MRSIDRVRSAFSIIALEKRSHPGAIPPGFTVVLVHVSVVVVGALWVGEWVRFVCGIGVAPLEI